MGGDGGPPLQEDGKLELDQAPVRRGIVPGLGTCEATLWAPLAVSADPSATICARMARCPVLVGRASRHSAKPMLLPHAAAARRALSCITLTLPTVLPISSATSCSE